MATTSDELLQAIRSYATGILKGNTADTLGVPVDLINELIVRPIAKAVGRPDIVSDAPIGGSKSLRTLLRMNPEDANLAETAGSMISAGGAVKAIILPALVSKSIKDVKKAERALAEGTDAAQVEKYTGIFRLPENIDDGVLRTVLDDSKAKLRYSDTPDVKGVQRRQSAVTSNGPAVNVHISASDILKLPEVLDHPQLFAAIPELKKTRVINEFGGFRGAAYFPDDDIIRIASDSSPENFIKTLLHEVQHAVQTKFNMNPGGSPRQFLTDSQAFKEAKAHIDKVDEELMKLFRKTEDPELVAKIMQRQEEIGKKQKALREVDAKARDSYFRIAGEREASAVEAMRDAGPRQLPTTKYYGTELDRLIQEPTTAPKVDNSSVVQMIIERALNEVARKN